MSSGMDFFAPYSKVERGARVATHASETAGQPASLSPWPVLVVDDDEEVHLMTRLVLGKLRYQDRPLELISARSAAEAEGIVRRRRDIAVILLDIVMETDDAGLRLAKAIRDEIGNHDVRIILRTGQPGQAPVRDVILNYDINDYKSKTELTAEKLFITIIAGLRGYDHVQSVRRAESANALKSSFLAAMSHEIRTPMNGVLGMLELMAHTRLDEEQQTMLATARDSAGVLLRIIDDILDFSKIEAGRLDLERGSVNLLALVESVAEAMAPAARKKGLRLHAHADAALPARVIADPVRLRQILFNLCSNAIKFTLSGHVSVVARPLAEATPLRAGETLIRFEVSDTGIGIAEDVQAKLFQPFVQAESSTTRLYGGTGLGLSISRRLTELMHGRMGLRSKPGQGSTFWADISLPTTPDEETPTALPIPSGARALLCSDDALLCATVADYIRAVGWTVEICEPGAPLPKSRADLFIRDVAAAIGPGPGILDIPCLLLADIDPQEGRKVEGQPDDDGYTRPDIGLVAIPVRRDALYRAMVAILGRARGRRADDRETQPALARAADAERKAQVILVAEDQGVNREVIRKQLALLGYPCAIFEDGEKALAAYRQGGYDLLLTDCNMPVMDGYALASAIRLHEEKTGERRLPIIALTANAMAAEADRCILAGMDDLLTKPLDLERLNRCLERWALPQQRERGRLSTVTEPVKKEMPTASLIPSFDPSIALTLFGGLDNEDARLFLDDFISSIKYLCESATEAARRSDAFVAKQQVHALAGVAKSGGAVALGAEADAIEAMFIAGATHPAFSRALALPLHIERVIDAVDQS
jgi:signal transduction histidine kinase/FixJ family two-component response regulator/HPt (histidine-containing phosphotransfer) domain-containing protein